MKENISNEQILKNTINEELLSSLVLKNHAKGEDDCCTLCGNEYGNIPFKGGYICENCVSALKGFYTGSSSSESRNCKHS